MKRSACVIALILAPLLPLWRAVLLGEAIGPFDQIRHMMPWMGVKPKQPWDVLQADAVLQFYPWRDMIFESWRRHQLPFWNPFELAGTPLLANSQSGAIYPPHIVAGLLFLPTSWAITLLAWFHLAVAGLGTFFLTRTLGGSRLGATIAGLSFSISAFMIGWTGLASVISTVAWIPWILGFLTVLLRGIAPDNQARTKAYGLGLAFSVALMLLAGHLQFAAYGIGAAILLILATLATGARDQTRFSALPGIVLAVIVGGLYAAPQILPVLGYSQFSHRKNAPTAEGYDAYVAGAIKPFELATLSVPNALGSPRVPIEAGDATIQQYWPPLVKRGANFAESAITIGPLILIGLFLVPWGRREVWPIAIVGLIALLLALGTALNWPLYFLVPGWSSSGSPGRIVVVFLLSACVLGGLGLGELDLSDRRAWIKVGIAVLLGLVLAWLAPAIAPAGPEAVDQLRSGATSAMVPVALIGAVLAVISVVLLGKGGTVASVSAIAGPLILCWVGNSGPLREKVLGPDLLMTGAPLNPIRGVDPNVRVALINDAWSLAVAVPALAPPNTAAISRVHELGGYDSLLHKDTVELLRKVDGQDPAPPANGNMMFVKPTAERNELAEAGVTEVWYPTNSVPQALPGPGRCTIEHGDCRITSEGYDRISLDVNGHGKLVLRDRMMPGWEARLDGKRVPLEDGLWRTINVPTRGHHAVEFHYSPPGFRNGMLLAVAALVLTVLFFRPTGRIRPT